MIPQKRSREEAAAYDFDRQAEDAFEALNVDTGLESPARRLQHLLNAELHGQFGENVLTGKWSIRRSITFIVITCSLFWFIMWMGLKALV